MNTDALILIASMLGLCSVVGAAVTLRRLPRRRDELPSVRLTDWEGWDYRWTCCICRHVNDGNDCERCGCPAEASYHYQKQEGLG